MNKIACFIAIYTIVAALCIAAPTDVDDDEPNTNDFDLRVLLDELLQRQQFHRRGAALDPNFAVGAKFPPGHPLAGRLNFAPTAAQLKGGTCLAGPGSSSGTYVYCDKSKGAAACSLGLVGVTYGRCACKARDTKQDCCC
jgi:hypothetical protein